MTQQRILQRQMGRSFSFGDVRTIALIAGLFALLGVFVLGAIDAGDVCRTPYPG